MLMISQQKLIDLIKAEIRHDIEDHTFEELQTYTPDECTIFEGVQDRLEEDMGWDYLESDGFYWRFRANFDELLESDWYFDLYHEAKREAHDDKQKHEHPYGYHGLTRGDFYA